MSTSSIDCGDSAPAIAAARGVAWQRGIYLYAAIVAAGFAYLLAQIPVQVSDCVANITRALTSPWSVLLADELRSRAFLRPFIHAQTKLVLDISTGWEFEIFRAIQIVQVVAAFWLFARLLRVRTRADAVGGLVAVAVFCGSHTFGGVLHEGYPINNPLTVALCALVALNIVTGERPRWWTDVLVVGAFVLSVGTIETGLLVWVTVAAGALAGCRGVSRAATAVMTVLVAAYFVVRFVILDVGAPNVLERSSGFMFERLEPEQLAARFGGDLVWFYAYNVISSLATVLFSEPRGGVVMIGQAMRAADVRPWMIVNIVSATSATMLILWFGCAVSWRRVALWTHGQRLLFVATGVLCANAAISYPYTKDQIMTVGGMFMAAAVAAPVAMLVASVPRSVPARAVALALLAAAASTWSLRVLGLQHALAHTAFVTRNDWASVDPIEAAGSHRDNRALVALITSLRTRAIDESTAYPQLSSRTVERWFDHTIR